MNWFEGFYKLISEGNSGLIVGLLIALAAMFMANIMIFIAHWRRIADKNNEIDRLVEERNWLQETFMDKKRKSSKRK